MLLSLVFPPGVAARGGRAVRAEPPTPVSRTVTDRAGALGGRRGQVEAALARLEAAHAVRLYVVYVEDFSGLSAQEWASQAALRGHLGRLELLLAVSVGQRRYAVSADSRFPLSAGELDEVAATAIEPALRHGDWAGAAVGAAEGYAEALATRGLIRAGRAPGEMDHVRRAVRAAAAGGRAPGGPGG
ncbi:TPM domain-containing protein [Streptosporangium carneum]|uniref:TPM domain-containing protein n=1 Tax=Streptosporangium carneum TaxID=47481 RepID=UPI0022F32C6D|nr:TPM domain-containing protein [Streptosporangium carneum]